MSKRWIVPILMLVLILPAVCDAQPVPEGPGVQRPVTVIETAPSPLPHVKPAFEDTGFWIGRQPDAEKILMTTGDIEKANRSAHEGDPEAVDIFSLPDEVEAGPWKAGLLKVQDQCGRATFYDLTNRPVVSDHLKQIFIRMDLVGMSDRLKPIYGVIIRETNLRILPTEDLIMDKPFDYAFDRFQSDRLDGGTPVVILHYTRDRQWCYVETGLTRGWIRPRDAAVGKKEDILRFAAAKPLVVSGRSASFYRDREFQRFAFDLPMGARLPYTGRNGDVIQVLLPCRDMNDALVLVDGFVRRNADVHEGYLPYTFGAVLRQAFKLKESFYNWGGLNGGRDCSRFIMEVFRCFGFQMPRDSYRQALFSRERRLDMKQRTDGEKVSLLKRFEHVPTLLYMKGHVMLFLGVVDDRAYAIHSYWDYGPYDRPNIVYHVGRVVVSDLSLGRIGEGTLLQWTTAVIPVY